MAGTEIAGQTPAVQIERLPITNYIPPEGVEFRAHKYVNMPVPGANAIVVQFTVPKGYNGIINYLANIFVGGGFQDGEGLITWELYLDYNNLVPAPNFQKIVASLGSVQNPAKLNGIRIKENQIVTLVVTNSNPGVNFAGQRIGGLLGGYYYPVALDPPNMTF